MARSLRFFNAAAQWANRKGVSMARVLRFGPPRNGPIGRTFQWPVGLRFRPFLTQIPWLTTNITESEKRAANVQDGLIRRCHHDAVDQMLCRCPGAGLTFVFG
jgi:hypothetical protein